MSSKRHDLLKVYPVTPPDKALKIRDHSAISPGKPGPQNSLTSCRWTNILRWFYFRGSWYKKRVSYLGKVYKISTFPSLSWLKRFFSSEKLVTSCIEVHYPENFLNPHYLHLILDITSDIELIPTTDGVYWSLQPHWLPHWPEMCQTA